MVIIKRCLLISVFFCFFFPWLILPLFILLLLFIFKGCWFIELDMIGCFLTLLCSFFPPMKIFLS
jgi:hypothetical protein